MLILKSNPMICPRCKREVKIPDYVFINAETYRKVCLSVSECCGHPFLIRAKTVFEMTEYKGNEKNDDWGNEIKSKK